MAVEAAAVENDDGLLMCEAGWDDEWFRVDGCFSILPRINRSRHDYVLSGAILY